MSLDMQLADLVLIFFTKEELHPDEERETKEEMIELAQEILSNT